MSTASGLQMKRTTSFLSTLHQSLQPTKDVPLLAISIWMQLEQRMPAAALGGWQNPIWRGCLWLASPLLVPFLPSILPWALSVVGEEMAQQHSVINHVYVACLKSSQVMVRHLDPLQAYSTLPLTGYPCYYGSQGSNSQIGLWCLQTA